MKSTKLALAITLAIAAMSASALPVESIIENGGFEVPRVAGEVYPTDVPGWRQLSGSLALWPSVTGGITAAEGRQYADVTAYADARIWQNINTTVDTLYSLSFAYKQKPLNGTDYRDPAGVYFTVLWNGLAIAPQVDYISDGWTYLSADNLRSRSYPGSNLTFMVAGVSTQYGGLLDAVTLVEQSTVPEPDSLALMIAGLFLLGTTQLIQRKKATAK